MARPEPRPGERLRVGLLFGGRSGEHEVSIRSAAAAAKALASGGNAEKYDVLPFYIQKDGVWQAPAIAQAVLESAQALTCPDLAADRQALWQFPAEAAAIDVWFPVLHGPNGEDGTVQGLLQLMQVPYVGSGVLGSAVGMDKIAMKQVFAEAGLPQVSYRAVTREQVWSNACIFPKLCDEIETALGYPCFVKPANLGSSVGIAKAKTRAELEAALDSAAAFDRRIIVEAAIANPREVECAVLGSDRPEASVIGEITYESEFYDYETKYTDGAADLLIPAPLPEAIADELRSMAIKAFVALNGCGLGRVDFFYSETTGELVINEINTLPGFTATSMYPQLWAATGVSFPELVDRLIQLAIDRAKVG